MLSAKPVIKLEINFQLMSSTNAAVLLLNSVIKHVMTRSDGYSLMEVHCACCLACLPDWYLIHVDAETILTS